MPDGAPPPAPLTACVSVGACARENAQWCEVVCATHGLSSRTDPARWWSPRRTLPFYPDAVALAPALTADELLDGLDISPGCTVKDSFGDLDLTGYGFEPLFTATWVVRDPAPPIRPRQQTLHWDSVTNAAELREWQRAWDPTWTGPDLFLPALLDAPGVVIGAGRDADGRLLAGVALHHTLFPGGDAVVGISNAFSTAGGHVEEPWPGALTLAAQRFPAVPLVGYEHGAGLLAVRHCGWAAIGSLRVWVRPEPADRRTPP